MVADVPPTNTTPFAVTNGFESTLFCKVWIYVSELYVVAVISVKLLTFIVSVCKLGLYDPKLNPDKFKLITGGLFTSAI